MHDGRWQRLRQVRGEPRSHLLDLRQFAGLVDLPELREPAHLALHVAAGARERGELVVRDVGGVDLHEGVDEVEAERVARLLGLEARRQLARDHVPVEVAASRRTGTPSTLSSSQTARMSASRPKPAARIAFCSPASRTMSCAVGGSGGRGGRRRTNLSSPRSIRKREVRAAAVADPRRDDRPGTEPVRVEELLDACSRSISGGLSAIAAMLRTMRRRLYLMRHAEVSYVGERDPEVVRLTERGLEQAAAAHRALRRRQLRSRRHERPASNARDGSGRRPGPRARAMAGVRGVARRPAGRRPARRARGALRRLPPGARRGRAVPRR